MPWLRKGCCCCTLKVGTIVIAVLQIIGTIFQIGIHIPLSFVIPEFTYFLIAFEIVYLAANIVLLVGAVKDMKYLLLPFLVTSLILFILQFVGLVLFMLTPLSWIEKKAGRPMPEGKEKEAAELALTLVKVTISFAFCINTGFLIYFLIVVFSLYQELSGR